MGLALGTALGFVHLTAADEPSLRRLETVAFDLRLRLRGTTKPGPETVIILVDEHTVASLGRWPLPRAVYADLLRHLRDAGARVIAFDMLFAEPEPALA